MHWSTATSLLLAFSVAYTTTKDIRLTNQSDVRLATRAEDLAELRAVVKKDLAAGGKWNETEQQQQVENIEDATSHIEAVNTILETPNKIETSIETDTVEAAPFDVAPIADSNNYLTTELPVKCEHAIDIKREQAKIGEKLIATPKFHGGGDKKQQTVHLIVPTQQPHHTHSPVHYHFGHNGDYGYGGGYGHGGYAGYEGGGGYGGGGNGYGGSGYGGGGYGGGGYGGGGYGGYPGYGYPGYGGFPGVGANPGFGFPGTGFGFNPYFGFPGTGFPFTIFPNGTIAVSPFFG